MSISTRDADKGRPARAAVRRLRFGGRGRGGGRRGRRPVFSREVRKGDRRPHNDGKAASVWQRAFLCSLKISESSQRPVQDKVLTSPPRPSDDGLTRREPESSGGKISAGLPARCWNTTGSCSVLRCQPQSPGAARAVPRGGGRPEKSRSFSPIAA